MKKTSQLKRILKEDRLKAFENAVAVDKIIVPILQELMESMCSELQKPTSISDFEQQSWALERAYRDGGAYYLQQVLNIFKEK